MKFQYGILLMILISLPLPAVGEELILPFFALNAENLDGTRLSTEVYLVNPTTKPVHVGVSGLLLENGRRSTCGQSMSQTHVVPPESAVLWTASGLAADLGCTQEIQGALKLHSDGPLRVTGRVVRNPEPDKAQQTGILKGGGHSVAAQPTDGLPGPTILLLPTLLWHRNPCGETAFSSTVGFVNPGFSPVTVTLDLPKERRRALQINGRPVPLPHQFVVEPESWMQFRLSPMDRPAEVCLEPESFDVDVLIDGPLAVYGVVFDNSGMDGRMVQPVDLQLN